MSHSYNKIWLHVVFATKNRTPLIKPVVEKQIHAHMQEQLIENGCPVRIINGMPDHVHLLFLQNLIIQENIQDTIFFYQIEEISICDLF